MKLDRISRQTLWRAGTDGYHTYRIPCLLQTPRGTVLAFCEGRRNSRSDSGDIDTVLRRSLDGGLTWGPQETVASGNGDTMGNPCPLVDPATGRILLLSTHNLGNDAESAIRAGTSRGTRTVWICHSDDDGITWSKPREITRQAKKDTWSWYATGPGVGIALKSGRLVVPCDACIADKQEKVSHIIYSDDDGDTWRIGGVTGPDCNECQIVELGDGRLLLNMRSYRCDNKRLVSYSEDKGLTFSRPRCVGDLVEPVCQASIVSHLMPDGEVILLFSNPASYTRDHMTLRASLDQGTSWPHSLLLQEGPAAYSCLSPLQKGQIGCLYEMGTEDPYEQIVLDTVGINE